MVTPEELKDIIDACKKIHQTLVSVKKKS